MGKRAGVVLYVLALVAVVVGVDILFFRHQFWERLVANVGIVVLFGMFYLRFVKRRWAQPPPEAATRPK
jgi:membrane protein implicated in regulation of membrane protease activity